MKRHKKRIGLVLLIVFCSAAMVLGGLTIYVCSSSGNFDVWEAEDYAVFTISLVAVALGSAILPFSIARLNTLGRKR